MVHSQVSKHLPRSSNLVNPAFPYQTSQQGVLHAERIEYAHMGTAGYVKGKHHEISPQRADGVARSPMHVIHYHSRNNMLQH